MKIAFVPFYFRCPQHRNSASIRLRCTWPAKYMTGAVVAEKLEDCADADVIIFQKAFGQQLNAYAKQMKEKGKKIVIDLCDPEWMAPGITGALCLEMIALSDMVMVPTIKMREVLRTKFPDKKIAVLEDCVDIEYHSRVKEDVWRDDPVVLWYGNRGTIAALQHYIKDLEELYDKKRFSLRVITDSGVIQTKIPTTYKEWNLDTFVSDAIECDIVINPKLPTEIDEMKSRNKTYTAWACGLPCIEVWGWSNREEWMDDMLDLLESPVERKSIGQTGRRLVEQAGTSKHYAERLREIITNVLGN